MEWIFKSHIKWLYPIKQKCYPLIYGGGQPTMLFKFPGTSKTRLSSEYKGPNTVIHGAHIRFLQFPPLHRQNVHQHFLLFCWAHVLPYQGHLGQHEPATQCSASTGKLCSFCRLQKSCLLDGQTIWIFTTTKASNLTITFLLYFFLLGDSLASEFYVPGYHPKEIIQHSEHGENLK